MALYTAINLSVFRGKVTSNTTASFTTAAVETVGRFENHGADSKDTGRCHRQIASHRTSVAAAQGKAIATPTQTA
jgi:hypothetical protein